jgi:transposase-like protein
MQKKARNEMIQAFEAELKELVRGLLEALMREERAMYLETHPTSANGCYTRDLLTLVGPVEDLEVPRVREGDFHPRILPYRKRVSLELLEIILALYAVGVSTRKIAHFLEGIYGAFYLPPLHSSRKKRRMNSCTWLSGSSPMDEGRSSGFGSLVQRGKAPGIGRSCLRTSGGVGFKGCESLSLMTFRD